MAQAPWLMAVVAVIGLAVPVMSAAEPAWVEAVRVADASDRAYEETAIWLLDHARTSITLSLYLLHAEDDPRHPITRLVGDLEEAARRGVAVTLYLNLRLRGVTSGTVLAAPWVARLMAAGVRMVPLTPRRMLHDKLLIVDRRYILEGSTNWSVEALKTNWESNTVVDSPALAAAKLARLAARERRWGPAPPSRAPPPTVAIPAAWLALGGPLQRLAAAADERAFDTLLWVVRERAIEGTGDFLLSLELLGKDLGLPAAWDTTTVRRQVIKTLRKLETRYGVLTAEFVHSREARVVVTVPDGPSVIVPAAWLDSPGLTGERTAVTYLRLAERHWAGQGFAWDTWSLRELARRTGIPPDRLRAARRMLHPTGS